MPCGTFLFRFYFCILFTSLCSAEGMRRVVLLHRSDQDDTQRLKIQTDEKISYATLDRAIKAEVPAIATSEMEYYDEALNQFRQYDKDSEVTLRFITCYAKSFHHNRNGVVGYIRGRAFNIEKGLSLAGQLIHITDGEDRSQGTGLNTWDGSIVLAKYLELHPQLVVGKTVLELGSGTGLVGIAASLLGAEVSVLTDLNYTLANLVSNIKRNVAAEYSVGKVVARPLDWTNPDTYITPSDLSGDVKSVDRHWNVILGADVVWVEELVPPLVAALRSLSGPDTVVLLSHQVNCNLFIFCISKLIFFVIVTECPYR